jgi:hypothetical protein
MLWVAFHTWQSDLTCLFNSGPWCDFRLVDPEHCYENLALKMFVPAMALAATLVVGSRVPPRAQRERSDRTGTAGDAWGTSSPESGSRVAIAAVFCATRRHRFPIEIGGGTERDFLRSRVW